MNKLNYDERKRRLLQMLRDDHDNDVSQLDRVIHDLLGHLMTGDLVEWVLHLGLEHTQSSTFRATLHQVVYDLLKSELREDFFGKENDARLAPMDEETEAVMNVLIHDAVLYGFCMDLHQRAATVNRFIDGLDVFLQDNPDILEQADTSYDRINIRRIAHYFMLEEQG